MGVTEKDTKTIYRVKGKPKLLDQMRSAKMLMYMQLIGNIEIDLYGSTCEKTRLT